MPMASAACSATTVVPRPISTRPGVTSSPPTRPLSCDRRSPRRGATRQGLRARPGRRLARAGEARLARHGHGHRVPELPGVAELRGVRPPFHLRAGPCDTCWSRPSLRSLPTAETRDGDARPPLSLADDGCPDARRSTAPAPRAAGADDAPVRRSCTVRRPARSRLPPRRSRSRSTRVATEPGSPSRQTVEADGLSRAPRCLRGGRRRSGHAVGA